MVRFGSARIATRRCLCATNLMSTLINTQNPTRDVGLQHLEQVKGKLGRQYTAKRNFDYGAGHHNSVTNLSPWIRHRLLLEEEAVKAALSAQGYSRAEKFIQEVFWRTYWKGWLEMRPQVWRDFTVARDAELKTWQNDSGYLSATSGETGIECFDCWIRELKRENYLHNHARMWFASIWIFTLRLPWVLGANFFLQHLLDGDPASNTLSWRWVAGIQTRGKTYLARSENIAKYTQGRFDPKGQLATSVLPIDAPLPPTPSTLKFDTQSISDKPSLLLVTDDDMGLETAKIKSTNLVGIVSINTARTRTPHGIGNEVADFIDNALDTAVNDYAKKHKLSVYRIQPNDGGALLKLANQLSAQQVIGLQIPIGPGKDAITDMMQELLFHKIVYSKIVRPWDQVCWPYAKAGFFRFRSSIPSMLGALSLN